MGAWHNAASAAAAAAASAAAAVRRDPWLLALGAGHAATLTAVVAARDHQALQVALLAAAFVAVRGGATVNAALAARWRAFASRNYFDEGGGFYAAAVAAPLLAVMCVQLVSVLRFGWCFCVCV